MYSSYPEASEMKKSAWKWVFAGMFSMTPVTVSNMKPLSAMIVLPIGSSSPKYLRAVSSLMTREYGASSAVIRISPDQGQREKVEQRTLRPVDPSFVVDAVFVLHDPGAGRGVHAQAGLYFGEVGLERGSHAARRLGVVVERDPVDPVGLIVVAVIAQFVAGIQEDQDRAGHADRQAQDVDQRIALCAGSGAAAL